MMRRKIYREENSEPGRYNEEALDYKLGIREQPLPLGVILGRTLCGSFCLGYQTGRFGQK